jgi:hypothetical protein
MRISGHVASQVFLFAVDHVSPIWCEGGWIFPPPWLCTPRRSFIHDVVHGRLGPCTCVIHVAMQVTVASIDSAELTHQHPLTTVYVMLDLWYMRRSTFPPSIKFNKFFAKRSGTATAPSRVAKLDQRRGGWRCTWTRYLGT